MNRKRRQDRNMKLPMMELIISIGIFAIISVFLLELFLVANSLQRKAKDKGKAITLVETVGESIKAADSFEAAKEQLHLQETFASFKEQKDGSVQMADISEEAEEGKEAIYALHYDADWNETEQPDMYSVIVLPSKEVIQGRVLEHYDMYVYRLKGYASLWNRKDHVELYHLRVSKYRGEQAADAGAE